jgi:hypothetical protein
MHIYITHIHLHIHTITYTYTQPHKHTHIPIFSLSLPKETAWTVPIRSQHRVGAVRVAVAYVPRVCVCVCVLEESTLCRSVCGYVCVWWWEVCV